MQALYTVKEAATKLRVSPRTVYRLIEERKIPFRQIGARVMLLEEDLESFIREAQVKPINPPQLDH